MTNDQPASPEFKEVDLPDKPSDILEMALNHLRECERDDKYTVYMERWHQPSPARDTCYVCLAGAVVAKGFHASRHDDLGIGGFRQYPKLQMLDRFRNGRIERGFECLERTKPKGVPAEISVPEYKTDRELWFSKMEELIRTLRKCRV